MQLLSLGLEELRAKAAEVAARLKRQHSGMPAPVQKMPVCCSSYWICFAGVRAQRKLSRPNLTRMLAYFCCLPA